jgi:hypothetical protein
VWDWLHGTLRLNVPQEKIKIGIPAFQNARAVILPAILAMPFREQPDYWKEEAAESAAAI